ncbi:MAG: DNA recombination protein RmuC [Rhodobacteraceae bacterium]|nr:DNA recombination protein RmuC [Paracoccaceae bacterium]
MENLAEQVEQQRAQITGMGEQKDELEHINSRLTADLRQVQTERDEQAKASERALRDVREMQEKMVAQFEVLSAKALTEQGEAVALRNQEMLKGTLDPLLAPLKENVTSFQQALTTMHETGVKDRATLTAEIKSLTDKSQQISQDAVALTRALKADQQKQGAWGEMVLEKLLEGSGLRKGEEYEVQTSHTTDDGRRLRPDVVVKMPGDKNMVIDSKVSLVAFTDLVNAETDKAREEASKKHIASLKAHIANLASKDYAMAAVSSVDYVILFVPIEGALSEALRIEPGLTELAVEKNVMIATPTTLMMALKTVSNVWIVERRNQNAEDIARRAGKLYDKVRGFVLDMKGIGQRLDQAQVAYGNAMNKLHRGHGNVLGQVESLKQLGAKTNKSLPSELITDDTAEPDLVPSDKA